MYLELAEGGFVKFIYSPNRIMYRPTSYQAVMIGDAIHIANTAGKTNDTIIVKLNDVEGERCSPPIRINDLDIMLQDFQQYFNPTIGSSSGMFQTRTLRMLEEIKALLQTIANK